MPVPDSWLDQVKEDIIDPDLPIVDPHHHLWTRDTHVYEVEQLLADTGSGHNVTKTVYMECGSRYRDQGPDHMKPVAETEFVVKQADKAQELGGSRIAGIISHADLRMGEDVVEVLEAHEAAGNGLFRGIRHAGAWMEEPFPFGKSARDGAEDLYDQSDFRTGVKVLGRLELTYDTYHYHNRNKDYARLAQAVPDTQFVFNHFGTPVGVGHYADKRQEIFDAWVDDIAKIAKCDNVVAKIGGLAMPVNGFGWDLCDKPATSDEFVEAQRPYFMHAIECFGVERCMMESNFPVDRNSLSYHVLFNGLKKIVADFSEDEKNQLFHGTAERVYNV
ncbi:MAG TPA: amidohydrolase [Gammaproteobacteria bacterium]|nr:amidohydrolase [Gammaproteobacteria bacterium]HAK51974.1 amidohydrolase [Gammaproteobacteria bacterium]